MELVSNGLIVMSVMTLGVSLVFLVRYTFLPGERRTATTRLFGAISLALLVLRFALESYHQGTLAFNTMRDSILFFATVLLAADMLAAGLASSQVLSLLITPAVLALTAVSLFCERWLPAADARRAVSNAFFFTHMLLFTLSYALFFVGAAFAGLFLMLDNILKSRELSPLFFKLPGLTKLDRYCIRSLVLGVVFLTVGIGLGFSSLLRLKSGMAPVAPARASVDDFTILTTVLLWLYYVVFIWLRSRFGWVGRRSCYIALCGVLLLLLFYFAGKIMPAGRLHGFGSPVATIARPL